MQRVLLHKIYIQAWYKIAKEENVKCKNSFCTLFHRNQLAQNWIIEYYVLSWMSFQICPKKCDRPTVYSHCSIRQWGIMYRHYMSGQPIFTICLIRGTSKLFEIYCWFRVCPVLFFCLTSSALGFHNNHNVTTIIYYVILYSIICLNNHELRVWFSNRWN